MAEATPIPPIGQPDPGVALLLEGQRLGYRLMHAEPPLLISLMMGIAIDSICTKSLEKRLANRTDTDSVALLDRLRRRTDRKDALRERSKKIVVRLNDTLIQNGMLTQERIWVLRDEGEKVRQALKEAAIPETARE